MRKLLTILLLVIISKALTAQDISVIAITSPVSGCSLSATSSVTINVKNVGLTDLSGTPFNVSYTINAGAPVTEAVNFPFFTPNTTVSYTFTITANLSVPATYTFTAYSTFAGDINTTNDATTGYNVISTGATVGGTVLGTNVCKGINSGTLTLSGQTGNVLSWESSIDAGTTWIPISNTTTSQSYNNLTVQTLYRAQVQNGVCASAASSIATMTIDPASIGGTVSGTATVCSGINTGTMTSSGRTGNILKWQYSVSPFTVWTDIANVTATETYTNIVATRNYRVEVQSGACSSSFSTAVVITVSPTTVGGIVSGGATVCSGVNGGTLTLGGQTGTVSRWEFSTNAGSAWTAIINTTTSQTYTNLVATRWYRALVKSGSCSAIYSTVDSIVVKPSTVAGSVTANATVCSGANAGTLTLAGYVGVIRYWEFSTNGGVSYTPIANTTNTQNYLNLVATTIYRANVQNGTCPPANSTTATITVNPVSVGGTTVSNATVCSGVNSGTITLSGYIGSISGWEFSTDGITWSPIANATASQAYTNLINTTYYHVLVKSGVCASVTSSTDTITVDLPTVGGGVSASTNVCYGNNSGTLTLIGNTGSVVRWEYSIDGGINWIAIANTTISYIYTNVTLTTEYRAVVKNGKCSTINSLTATLTIDPVSVGGTLNGSTTACGGLNNGTLKLINYVGTIKNWESSIDGGISWTTIANTTTTQNYLNVPTTTDYRVIVKSGVCSNDTSSIVTITIDPATIGGILTIDDTVCAGANLGTLKLAGYTGTIQHWESSSDGGVTWLTLANTSTSQTYSNLISTTSYRVFVKSGVCNGATSNTVKITVDPIVFGGTLNGSTTVCDTINNGTLKLTGAVGSVQNWESSIDGGISWTTIANTTTSHTYTNLTDTTWFRAIVTSGACGKDTSSVAIIYVNPATVGGIVSVSDTVCAGANNGTLTLSGFTGTVQRWEFSSDGGTTWVTLTNTTTTQNYSNLMITTLYRAYVKSGICNGNTSMSAKITVTPLAVGGNISGSTSVCQGANGGTLTLTGYTGTIADWESSINGGTTWVSLVNTTATQTYTNLIGTTYYRAIVSSGLCPNDTSSYAIINIYPKPQGSFTADTVCLGNTTTFVNTSTISSGFIQFNQWDFGDNNSSISKNPSHTYAVADTFAVVLLTTSNFGCPDTAMVNVIVNPLPLNTITASGPLQFCAGDSVTLSAATGTYDYMWSNTNTTQNITVKISGTFGLVITDTITGCSSFNVETVKVFPKPVVFAGNDFTLSLGSSKNLNASGVGIVSWIWLPNTGLNGVNIPNPSASPTQTTIYQLTGTDMNGCSDVDSITITVLVDYKVIISNLMTPNDDGYNDRWIIQNIENYPDTKVIVVNREGQQVFQSDSYDNNWDGTNTYGKKLPDATYYYIVQFQNSDKLYKGAITILKEK